MTFRTACLVRALLCVAAAAPTACVANNMIGIETDAGTDGPLVQYVAISYDSTNDQLIAGAVGSLKFFDATDGHKLREIAVDEGLAIVARRAGGMITAVDPQNIWIFDEPGNLLRTIPQPVGLFAAAISADGSLVATGDLDGHLHLFRTATGAEIGWPALASVEDVPFYSAAFSPDGTYLAASSASAVRIWNVSDGALVAEIPAGASRIAISITGELAVAGDQMEIFAIPSGTKVTTYPLFSSQPHVVYSADGTLLAGGPQAVWTGDSPIRIIDRVSGESLVLVDDPATRPPQIGGKPRYVVDLTFAGPDRIAVAWDDGRVAAFRLSDGGLAWSRVDAD